MEKIGSLKMARLLKGITQIELQIMTGIQQSCISHAERGLIPLNQAQQKKVEAVLDEKINWNENKRGKQ